MASITALRALLGASLGLGTLDLVWLDLALAPRVLERDDATPRAHAAPPNPAATPGVPSTAVMPDDDRGARVGGEEPLASTARPAARPAIAAPSATVDAAVAAPVMTTTRVYFASTSATLDGTARAALERLAATVPAGAALVVEGHADHRGGESYNQALSRQRAVTVEAYLVAHGVARARIRVGYVGEAEALGDGELWRDRRVDIQITSQHTGGER